jgi:dihydroxyacid dehydratase/phosphogluconate dehydratase
VGVVIRLTSSHVFQPTSPTHSSEVPGSWAGPIGLVEDGDPISIDVAARRLDLEVDPAELDRRRQAWKPPQPRYARGALAKYAALVGGADQGAVCG